MSNAFSLLLAHPQASLLLGPTAVMRAMLSMERELVLAQADLGLVSREHAQTVASCCAWDHQDELQVDAWVAQAASAGSLAIPLVNALKARVRERDPQALAAVHLGATSQDLIDTALSVQGRQVLTLIDEAVQRVLRALIHLKQAHGQAPLLARTLMQPAAPTVLEARLLNWALPLQRSRQALSRLGQAALTLQLAGPVGDAAVWGQQAVALRQAVARRMNLPLHPWVWQVQRDDRARLAAELGVLVGALAKVGLDVALMSQAEVAELHESAAEGRGGSSAMPHKRNPVGALVALSAVQRAPHRVAAVIGAMAASQERGLGSWQAEGAELADLMIITAGSAAAMADALEHATADPQRMGVHLQTLHSGTGTSAPSLGSDALGLAGERARLWTELERSLMEDSA
ncbi:MAG: 3-carboxy-cis,cis-muconate cycloisomerase [Betaproteobacteria bacterium]|nr:3-carboxy-cis,cis-muconate cycloisomerase [Betaproteobacteria bacterium]NBT09577.1 3-carboxy-cis,cis-muconate cycloisomerase [Betaproteobacteria bacterium]NBX96079.1 3-carboxy-cis,cis-muconate cycloisomerase [Betaproteobacteria bacterium]